jgi:hypothetical protein
MSLCKTHRWLIARMAQGQGTNLGAPSLARFCFCAKGGIRALLAPLALLAVLPAAAQYVGTVAKPDKGVPELRSVAVLEWTGDLSSPKASRLIPVSVLDDGELQDGGIYLARPEPLAVAPQVEYQLEEDGKPTGLFDIKNAGQQFGSWVGLGSWKPMPSAPRKPTAKELAKTRLDDNDAQSDTPVLHRKHHADDSSSASPGGSSGSGKSGSGSDSGAQTAPSDPDRPVLHKKSDSDSASNPNPSTGDTASNDSSDPDRPTLHKSKKAEAAAEPAVESVPGDTDPDRPRLKRGKFSADAVEVAPTLVGFPPDLQQAVAVSDAKARPAHPWNYSWSSADDEAKMKAQIEDLARDALGMNPPPAAPAPKRASTTRKSTKPAPPPPPPAALEGEEFRVFELAYGSGATLVLSAHTGGAATQQKFVTLITQPDLYGNLLVLKKNVTDGAHLDDKPRMRLVDAVDALADNRGELLFELRGNTQRQFALYRVLRGQAEQLFVTGGGQFGSSSSE